MNRQRFITIAGAICVALLISVCLLVFAMVANAIISFYCL